MRILKHTIEDEYGLHARPAGRLVEICQGARSRVMLRCGEREADCKRLFSVLSAGIQSREIIEFRIEGPDEDEICAALESYILGNGV